ncbi:conserved hypothetical protein [Heliomicrobium modesticaldum Ice1]|uniref:Uncharacterized protein n=1 Tax=Heliobacterium modesticaldum (strain ATCC 51547 / Ice1) TaxID=498761 RepID=B0TAI2_HELMI|nr:hypothetical protein [Heliomicrobium modesticaldum]ABZ85032.1 conserved hypothetical protein [Heliomicrobium modesticaldum Ice1]
MLRLTWLSTVLALAFLILSCAAPIEKEVENRGKTKADERIQRGAPAMVGSQTVAVIIDGSAVATELDFSESAATIDDDELLVVREPIMARAWKGQFDEMWEEEDNYVGVK